MKRRRAWLIALAAASGCGGGAKAVAIAARPPPSAASLEIVRVTRSCGVKPTGEKVCDPDGFMTLWGGDLTAVGKQYAVLDERGYAALVRLTGQGDVDDGEVDSEFSAMRVSGRDPPIDGNAVAVGPVDGPLERASLHIERDPPHGELEEDWLPFVQVDLDGNGSVDLEEVRRCKERVQVGCPGRTACEVICRGIRVVGGGAPAAAAHVTCWSRRLPDEDCADDY